MKVWGPWQFAVDNTIILVHGDFYTGTGGTSSWEGQRGIGGLTELMDRARVCGESMYIVL